MISLCWVVFVSRGGADQVDSEQFWLWNLRNLIVEAQVVTMPTPTTWPEELLDPNTSAVTHPDIAALDVENGKWFSCNFCRNPKDPTEHKYVCRTPFSNEFLNARGHFESKSHKDNKHAAEKKPPLKSLFAAAGPSTQAASAPDASASGDMPACKPKPTLP